MTEGRPPKPGPHRGPSSGTPPSGTRPVRTGSSPQIRHAAARPASSTALPRGVPPRKAAPAPAAKAVSKPEIVASSDEQESSTVRRRVHAPTARFQGLSLRWKIVIGMGGITLATGILIFIVVYSKAVSQLNDEINVKGVSLLNMLASIDEEYWLTAIHTREESRAVDLEEMVNKLGGHPGWRAALRSKGLEGAYLRAIDPFSEAREAEIRELISQATGGTGWIAQLEGSTSLKKTYDRLVRPFPSLGSLRPLRELQKERQRGLLDAGVVDVSLGDANAPGIFLKGQGEVTLPSPEGKESVTIKDLLRKEEAVHIMSRTFIRNPAPDASRKLRYYVSLSLEGINSAKGALMWAILLPVFVSALLGVGIAIWISTLITEPIKVLMSDITEVSNGNLEHQTKVHSKDEVGLLASTFNKMTQALKLAHTQELEARALEHDLSIASEIQSNLVPKRMLKIPGYDISAYYRPSKEVGGDYYDFITIDEDNEGIVVADVSGKGIPGSLVMSMARAFIRMEAERSRNTSPSDTLVRANRMLAQDIKKGMFVTALYCILNKKSHEIRVASAGHNPMAVWRAAANQIELVNPSGIALGFDKGPVFERTVKEEKVVLNAGDRIVAYTDGVVEAMNAANQEFGDKRFYRTIQEMGTRDSNQMLNLLIKEIDEYRGEAPQSDDITVVTLRYL